MTINEILLTMLLIWGFGGLLFFSFIWLEQILSSLRRCFKKLKTEVLPAMQQAALLLSCFLVPLIITLICLLAG